MRACLMDGGYYLWNTAVPVIDSALYSLLMVLGNVLPVEELCCDFHSSAFNMEFNEKYEKLMQCLFHKLITHVATGLKPT